MGALSTGRVSQSGGGGGGVSSDLLSGGLSETLINNATTNVVIGNTGSHKRIEVKYVATRLTSLLSHEGSVIVFIDGSGNPVIDGGTYFGDDIGLSFGASLDGTDIVLECTLINLSYDSEFEYSLLRTLKV